MKNKGSKSESKLKKAIVASISKTFSDMAFVDAVLISDFPEELAFSHIVYIYFYEPMAGRIALFLPYECKKMIVENVYGRDWNSLQATEIDDCLLELLNILTGNFLNEYYGKELKHNVSLPELLFDDTELKDNEDCSEFFFDAEGIPFKILICKK